MARADKNKLNLAEVSVIGIGGMIGGGIFAVLGIAIATAGHAVAYANDVGNILMHLGHYQSQL
jgi:amino acid transporter